MHRVAKEIYTGLKNETLDPVTAKTFRWLRKRQTNAEKALNEDDNGMVVSFSETKFK